MLLICISAVFISCGGSKKIVNNTPKTQTSTPKRTIVEKEVKTIKTPKETTNKLPVTAPYAERVQNYIYEYAPIAKNEMNTYGIPASITLAQGILESGAGYGELTSKANNHFGIKCHNWTGEKVYHDDDLAQECFRKYDKASHSFRDHSLFLANRKRYAKLFTYKKSDYKSWARGLRAAGYATDKKYPEKLISIIERYQLYSYDKEVLKGDYQEELEERPIVSKSEDIVVVSSEKLPPLEPVKTEDVGHVVKKGDTLYSISKRYRIQVSELKTYNNLTDNKIVIGQVLRVTPDDDIEEF
ncbi:glucosaminidase domain-containing protein [Aquimarina addita]